MSASNDDLVQELVGVTGAPAAVAAQLLESHDNNLERAAAAFFEAEAASEDAVEDMEEEEPPAAALPGPSSADLVKSILDGAAKPEDSPPAWLSSAGRTLGGADEGPAPAAASAPAAPERTNPKKVRVLFWADGFTVEDITAEEAEAAQQASQQAAAPRRTGLATLGSASERAASRPAMPKLPPLRKYEENAEFMEDLKQGIPPVELRELDLSSGTPRPRPVDIMLGDLRPAPYPAEVAQRQQAMAAAAATAKPAAGPVAFSGAGQTLGGATSSAAASSDAEGGAAAAWERASLDTPQVDAAAPTTDIQVRLPAGSLPPQRFKLNRTHTVRDLLTLLEGALQAAAVPCRPYVLLDGFPPKPLAVSDATLEAAGLINAALTLRWS